MGTTVANLMKYPRKNNCYKQTAKRKVTGDKDKPTSKKMKLLDGNESIMSLYKAVPRLKTPKTSKLQRLQWPKSRKTPNTSTTVTTANTPTTKATLNVNDMIPTGVRKRIVQNKLEYTEAIHSKKIYQLTIHVSKSNGSNEDQQDTPTWTKGCFETCNQKLTQNEENCWRKLLKVQETLQKEPMEN